MTTVWSLRHNVTDFKSLASRSKDLGTPLPPDDRLPPGTPRLETWEDHYVWYDPTGFRKNSGIANFPRWSSAIGLVCDTEAKEVIRELLADHVEFLPLIAVRFNDTAYHAINVLKILDCLDHERSEFTYFKSTGGIFSIRKFEFKPDCIGETPIFKLPILNSISTYVTDEFKQLVEDNNLTGLKFYKVWEG